MNVCYLGPLFDHSGYGEANRNAVAALCEAGVTVNGVNISYVNESSDPGPIGRLMRTVCGQRNDYDIKILHVTPDQYKKYVEEGKYNIGHFFWETDRVPEDFAEGLKLVNEVWTGSQANKDALIKSGIKCPINIYPQAINTKIEWPNHPYKIKGFRGYKFYSIFEWTDRKNPEALLRAFWEEFEGVDDVCLIIKTYFRDFTLKSQRHITSQIAKWKSKSGIKNFPKVYLYLDLMDRKHIMRLHETGDCYVSPHRGEGWGLPIVEAMQCGHPVIATGYGGVGEYIPDPLPYKMVPLKGMTHSSKWYCPDQNWAEVGLGELKRRMRLEYEFPNHDNLSLKTVENFSYKKVGKLMADRLEEIQKELQNV